jgi:hypothetical protein
MEDAEPVDPNDPAAVAAAATKAALKAGGAAVYKLDSVVTHSSNAAPVFNPQTLEEGEAVC